jgi:antitoxin component of MazEF toxin-antitoxin module
MGEIIRKNMKQGNSRVIPLPAILLSIIEQKTGSYPERFSITLTDEGLLLKPTEGVTTNATNNK